MGRVIAGCKLGVYTLPGRRYLRVFFHVDLVCTERNTRIVRILIANTPRMYRESLALSIHQHRPDFEVLIANPNELNGQIERLSPQVLVRDDDGAATESPDGVVCWVGIKIDNHLHARIAVNGRISELHDVSLEEFLAALDETKGLLATEDI